MSAGDIGACDECGEVRPLTYVDNDHQCATVCDNCTTDARGSAMTKSQAMVIVGGNDALAACIVRGMLNGVTVDGFTSWGDDDALVTSVCAELNIATNTIALVRECIVAVRILGMA